MDYPELRGRLEEQRAEHVDLDTALAALVAQGSVDQLAVARLKKRKLALKDSISRLEALSIPDIIA